ncbi:protein LSM14 homolog car-1-like isoform X2 [Lineus longissimus]|uniref:protein LSM14 homolog car-1-like isoform X2 n=1 Tax=Lineus longissimus TaxID=88925 RepID=UPI002B4EE03F
MSGIPYIGSKISLISKAEIRYEGTLYTIDSAESTVTLQNVRSHGTEDRLESCPIPPRDEVYEYIIFRGGDIKDIHVCEPPKPPPVDPAIIETSQVKPKPQPCDHGQPQVASGYGQYTPFGNSPMNLGGYSQFGRPGAAPGSQLPPPGQQQIPQPQPHLPPHSHPHGHGHGHFQHGVQQPQPPVQPPPGQGSRGSTPTQGRKSPNDDSGHMADNIEHEQHHQIHQHHPHQQRPLRNNHDEHHHEHHDRDMERDDRQAQRQRGGGYHRPRGRGGQRGGPGHPGEQRHQGEQRHPGDRQPGDRDRHPHPAQINRGRGRRPPPGLDRRQKEPLKFETEFDFEESNAKFDKEELEKELKKLTLNDKVVNGDNKETNSQVSEDEEEEEPVCYNKTKSFFDSISCEATERAKGVHTRPNWREERKINSETFGVNSTKEFNRHRFSRGGRGRGGYQQGYRGRGRGRGYGGGRPQGGRGGRRDYGYGYNNQQYRQNSGESQQKRQPRERVEGNERQDVPPQ